MANGSTPRHRRALATAIRVMRAERDLSQEAVEAAGRLSTPAVQRAESGRVSVGFDILVGIAAGLGVSLGELIAEYERQLTKKR